MISRLFMNVMKLHELRLFMGFLELQLLLKLLDLLLDLELHEVKAGQRVLFRVVTSLVVLDDPLEVLGRQEPEGALEWGAHPVGEHHAGVHNSPMQDLKCFQVGLQTVTDQNIFGFKFHQKHSLNLVNICVDVLQIRFSYSTESCVIVDDRVFWFDEGLVADLPGEVDDGHACQLIPLRSVAHFAIQCEDPALAGLPGVEGGDEPPHVVVVQHVRHVHLTHLTSCGI